MQLLWGKYCRFTVLIYKRLTVVARSNITYKTFEYYSAVKKNRPFKIGSKAVYHCTIALETCRFDRSTLNRFELYLVWQTETELLEK